MDGAPRVWLGNRRKRNEDSRYWRRTGGGGSCVDRSAAGLRGGTLRDAGDGGRQGEADPGPPDDRFRRVGLLEFTEERIAEHGAMAAERRDAAGGVGAAAHGR